MLPAIAMTLRRRVFVILVMLVVIPASAQSAIWPEGVQSDTFSPEGDTGVVHYYFVQRLTNASVTRVVVVMHGYPHDVANILTAGVNAADARPETQSIPIVAPLFMVAADEAKKCSASGTPLAQTGDLQWHCNSWLNGGQDTQQRIDAFRVMDSLLAALKLRWPTLQQITVAGFSAGGQFVQHYIGFSQPPAGVKLRFVVGDPGSWLYFDPRPEVCAGGQQWKYAMQDLPAWLTERASAARERYRHAGIITLEGSEDDGPGKGKYYGILDKSCAAMAQGEGRLQRGLAYHDYEQTTLHPVAEHLLWQVPGCRHDVQCVFNSVPGRRALFADER